MREFHLRGMFKLRKIESQLGFGRIHFNLDIFLIRITGSKLKYSHC